MKMRDRYTKLKDDIKTYKVSDEIRSHVIRNKSAYLCVISAGGGIALTTIMRRGSKVEVNVSVNLNNFEMES